MKNLLTGIIIGMLSMIIFFNYHAYNVYSADENTTLKSYWTDK